MQMSSMTNSSWQLDRQGNCLWKHRFPRQWNWLSTEKKNCPQGKEIVCTKKKKKKGSTGFNSAPNTRKTHSVHSHEAITRLGRIIVNTVTCCYSRRLATGLNAVILTFLCYVSAKKKWMLQKFWKQMFRWGGSISEFFFQISSHAWLVLISLNHPYHSAVTMREF